jgi:DNA primase
MVGRCIFHADGGRPNLHVYRDSQSWRCYRCGIGGDALAFVMRAEQVGFREAVDRLGGAHLGPPRAVPRPAPRPASDGPDDRTSEELAVLQAATSLYHHRLLAEPGALAYLARRGIDLSTIRRYRLGYAAGDQLAAYLRWQRLPLGAALQVGLLTRGGKEFLAGRLVVPELRSGRPVWLIGRTLAEDQGGTDESTKYLGLPGSKPLLGCEESRTSPTACAVEGVFDRLALCQWGCPALALLGTSIRPDQVDQLRTFKRVYLVLDNDNAGVEGTLVLQQELGPIAVPVALPERIKDPAELAPRADGQALFAAALLASVGASQGPEGSQEAVDSLEAALD